MDSGVDFILYMGYQMTNFLHTDLFALIFIVLCGGGIAGIFLMALWDWWTGRNKEHLDIDLGDE